YLAEVSNELTRDGSHLDKGIGRFLAALTAFHTLYPDNSIGSVSYAPSGTNKFHQYLSKIAAQQAVINPFKVAEWSVIRCCLYEITMAMSIHCLPSKCIIAN